jgi:hypothetical protein
VKANRYHISVTLEISVEVEADNEQEADSMVSDAVREEGYGDASIIGSRITETFIDGPKQYAAWAKAWADYHNACDRHGKGSVEAKALLAYAESLPSGV